MYNSTFKVVIVNSDQATSTTSSPRGIYEAAVRRAEFTKGNDAITAEPRLRYKQKVKRGRLKMRAVLNICQNQGCRGGASEPQWSKSHFCELLQNLNYKDILFDIYARKYKLNVVTV